MEEEMVMNIKFVYCFKQNANKKYVPSSSNRAISTMSKKSHMWETLNISMCVDRSTDTKMY